jgi:hypothetical protein
MKSPNTYFRDRKRRRRRIFNYRVRTKARKQMGLI